MTFESFIHSKRTHQQARKTRFSSQETLRMRMKFIKVRELIQWVNEKLKLSSSSIANVVLIRCASNNRGLSSSKPQRIYNFLASIVVMSSTCHFSFQIICKFDGKYFSFFYSYEWINEQWCRSMQKRLNITATTTWFVQK